MTGGKAQSAHSHGEIAAAPECRRDEPAAKTWMLVGRETYSRCVSVAAEAFESDRIRNLLHGKWQRVGVPGHHVSVRRDR